MLGTWGHGAYEFYNFLFIIAMFWTMHCKESIEAAQVVSTKWSALRVGTYVHMLASVHSGTL